MATYPLQLSAQAYIMRAMYYTDASRKGPVKYRDVIGSIGVLESPDKHMPIGLANCVTRDENGLSGWTLTVRGDAIPGRSLDHRGRGVQTSRVSRLIALTSLRCFASSSKVSA
jgi:hypothetical protein